MTRFRRPGPAWRAAAAALSLAVLGGLGLAAGPVQATTFPGTNGRIAGSGPLSASTNSQLELFTKVSAHSSVAGPSADCRLLFNENSDFNPRFSKDGKKIVWVQDNNLWTMQLDANGRCAADTNGNGRPDAGDGARSS
jgi:hypothetical protein